MELCAKNKNCYSIKTNDNNSSPHLVTTLFFHDSHIAFLLIIISNIGDRDMMPIRAFCLNNFVEGDSLELSLS